ncbi:MAG: hypothetical protein RMZ69_12905 [Nostoc sp. ChiQUE01a]|nr:hypothetical protein [Nostoc sp. ChiQUE01a]
MTISTALVDISHLSARCLASENKVLGVLCVDNPNINLNRGNRTFFLL